MNKRQIGAAGETAALSVYEKNGFNLIQRNWFYKHYGELDLILINKSQRSSFSDNKLIICEVKLRDAFGINTVPSIAVDYKKQIKIRRLTELFLMQNPVYNNCHIQFDVAEVFADDGDIVGINIIENAF